ncbi:MAG: hypothetical protein P1U42_10745 [Phycisphaerales bacterium]|nr:hypothetical protein [Phycisphaerales bacterium]
MTNTTPIMTSIEGSTALRRGITITSISMLIALSGLAGCSKSDDAQAAVKQAGRSFTSIAAGDSTAARPFNEQTYKETEDLVAGFAGSENGFAEAAAVTLAISKLGQASLASQDASTAETAALHEARVIRGMINEWLTMNAIALAADQFDPSQEIAEIDKIIKLREDDIQHHTTLFDRINSEIAEIDSIIADLSAKSDEERNVAGGLELQMPRVSATEAAQIAERVREHTLRADQFELEAMRNEGVVGQLRPGAREIQLNVEKANSQITLLRAARNELNDRAQTSRNNARDAEQATNESTNRINDAVAQYAQLRSNEVESANQKAISTTRASISALRDANSALKEISSLTKASAQQTLAECYSRQAIGFGEEAILYHALAEAGIQGDWTSRVESARASQAEAHEASQDAYQGAASALRGARIRGDEGDKIEATAARLDLLGGVEPEPEFEDDYESDEEYYDDEDTQTADDEETDPAKDED